MALRLIGTATTDVNGNAVLEDGYTGTGAGEVDIVAKCMVDGGSVVSQPYPVLDCLFRDGGVTGDSNYTAFKNYSSFNPQLFDDGTVITNSSSSNAYYLANTGDSSDEYDFIPPYVCEFDIVSVTGNLGSQNITILQYQGSAINKTFSNLSITDGCHMKITVNGTQVIYQKDDNTPITESYTSTKTRIGIILNNATLKYKDFKIYPI